MAAEKVPGNAGSVPKPDHKLQLVRVRRIAHPARAGRMPGGLHVVAHMPFQHHGVGEQFPERGVRAQGHASSSLYHHFETKAGEAIAEPVIAESFF